MTRVVVLTSSELRHTFFRKALAIAEGLEVAGSWCEGLEKTLRTLIDPHRPGADLQEKHLFLREASEQDFFGPFVSIVPDRSHPRFVPRGEVNGPEAFAAIQALRPGVLAAYGCSLVKDPLLSAFQGRFLNVHLGLSPWYRGSGTNFWPLVNGEPEYVGVTFMHIDAGVDTGDVIHQMRARVFPGDTPHQIGNRLIGDMTCAYAHILRNFAHIGAGVKLAPPGKERVYRKKDFTPESVERLYANFRGGLVERYLEEREARCARAPLYEHPIFQGWSP